MKIFSTQHKVFWAIFLAAATVCLALALSGLHKHHTARNTADMLRAIIASETRFQKISVVLGTNAQVYLEGSVNSVLDLEALHRLVEQAQLPIQPAFSVRVIPISLTTRQRAKVPQGQGKLASYEVAG
jgi:hypothetical protein